MHELESKGSTNERSPISGKTLGRYELLVPVARGGMGQVWAGRLCGGRGFQKLVAIKTILPQPGDEKRLEEMLQEEARLASQIQHANVVGVVELGEHEGALYLVMEWVDGEPLNLVMSRALEQGGMPLPVAVNLIGQACRGLHAVHELRDDAGELLGVVHRDVSPQNILITYTGTAKIVDFGIAKATNLKTSLTETGEIKGKFSYMSPEQIMSAPVDRRADLFSLGIVLYIMTTGMHPFKADNPAGTVHAITSSKGVTRPSKLVPGYPKALENVLLKTLAKSAEDRYDNAQDMLTALQKALPEAFEAGFEATVEQYLMNLVGERAVRRREALRKAQGDADKWRKQAGSGEHPAANAASFSSLRAVALEKISGDSASAKSIPAIDSTIERSRAQRSRLITPLGVGAAVMGFLIAASVGTYLTRATNGSTNAAPLPGATLTVVPQREIAPPPATPTVPPTASAVNEAAPIAAPALTEMPTGLAPATATHKTKAAKRTDASKKASAKPAQSSDTDLMAPDYATKH